MRKLKKSVAILVSVVVALSLGAGLSVSADNTPAGSTPKAIFVTFYGDAQTQRGFSWVTDNSGLSSLIKISTNSNLSGVTSTAGYENSSTATITGNDGTMEYSHQLVVENLTPGTKYYYQVGDNGTWSNTGSFTTEASNTNSFSFIDLTDTGVTSDYNSVYAPLLTQAFGSDPKAAFVMNNGDITSQGGDLSQWANYAAAKTSSQSQPLLSTTTFVPVSGDTDTYSNQDTSLNEITCTAGAAGTTTTFAAPGEKVLGSLTNAFIDHFKLPIPSTETNTTNGAYYSFDYGNAHIMVLNTNDFVVSGQTTSGKLNQSQVGNALQQGGTLKTQATDWLTNECATTTQKWKIVVLHRAVQSIGSHMADPDITALRAQLLPIMAEDSIDLVLEGHDLSFLRSQPTAEDYQGSVPPYAPATTYNNTKDEPAALGTSQITETYNGLSTTFEINAQGNTVYTYGPGVNGTTTDPNGTAPTPGTTGGTVYVEPGVSNGTSSIFSRDYFDMLDANAASSDNSPFYGASNSIFPDVINPSTLRTPPTGSSTTSTGATLTAPTYSAVNISGDKLVVTTYQYNASGKPTVIDNHGLAKPDAQTALVNQINALPSIDNLTVSNASTVKAAYDAFNALDAVDQTTVTNSSALKNDVSLMQQMDPSAFVKVSTTGTGTSNTANPNTGNNFNICLLIILVIIGAGVLSILLVYKKKTSHQNSL